MGGSFNLQCSVIFQNYEHYKRTYWPAECYYSLTCFKNCWFDVRQIVFRRLHENHLLNMCAYSNSWSFFNDLPFKIGSSISASQTSKLFSNNRNDFQRGVTIFGTFSHTFMGIFQHTRPPFAES